MGRLLCIELGDFHQEETAIMPPPRQPIVPSVIIREPLISNDFKLPDYYKFEVEDDYVNNDDESSEEEDDDDDNDDDDDEMEEEEDEESEDDDDEENIAVLDDAVEEKVVVASSGQQSAVSDNSPTASLPPPPPPPPTLVKVQALTQSLFETGEPVLYFPKDNEQGKSSTQLNLMDTILNFMDQLLLVIPLPRKLNDQLNFKSKRERNEKEKEVVN